MRRSTGAVAAAGKRAAMAAARRVVARRAPDRAEAAARGAAALPARAPVLVARARAPARAGPLARRCATSSRNAATACVSTRQRSAELRRVRRLVYGRYLVLQQRPMREATLLERRPRLRLHPVLLRRTVLQRGTDLLQLRRPAGLHRVLHADLDLAHLPGRLRRLRERPQRPRASGSGVCARARLAHAHHDVVVQERRSVGAPHGDDGAGLL